MSCACGNPGSVETCCGPLIEGSRSPETAEELMRARYTAFTLEKIDYLMDTNHPSTRDERERENLAIWARESEWLGLEIVHTEAGGPEDATGEVEFVARYKAPKSGEVRHHEVARFSRVDGRWMLSGSDLVKPRPVTREAPKVGRNDPCPCHSGKKYKKCCGA